MKEFREKVKALRKIRGWSQEDLARSIEVSLFTVQRREARGARQAQSARRGINRLFKESGIETE
jgi:ribosome-binding protein aMBF1 (putative translation factor)